MMRTLGLRWIVTCALVAALAWLVHTPEPARGGPSGTFVFPLKVSGKTWDTTQVGKPGKKLGVGKVRDKTLAAILRGEVVHAASDYLHLDSSGRFFLYYDGKDSWRVATNQFGNDVTTLAGQVTNDGTFWMRGEYEIPMGAGTGKVFAQGKVKFLRGVFDPKSVKGLLWFFSPDIDTGMIVKFKTLKPVAELVILCGDGIRAGNEECDGNDDDRCPGECRLSCTCEPLCGNDRKDQGEICDGTDTEICDQFPDSVGCFDDCAGCHRCGDGILADAEQCDVNALDHPNCPGGCTVDCTCACVPGDPNTCPGTTCCDAISGFCCTPRINASDPPCPLLASGCSGLGSTTLVNGLCDGLIPPGGLCPDQDGDSNTFFACHICDGKGFLGECTITPEQCILSTGSPQPLTTPTPGL